MKLFYRASLVIIPAALCLGGCKTSDTMDSSAGKSKVVSAPGANVKNEIIPKGVEFVKPEFFSDTVEYYTSQGNYTGLAKDFHGFPKPLAKSSLDKSPTGDIITAVDLVAGTTSCPGGFTKIDKDLNEGASGNFVYLCYSTKYDSNDPYRSFTDDFKATVNSSSNYKVHVPDNTNCSTAGSVTNCRWAWVKGVVGGWAHQGDLNSGAGGSYIYLSYTPVQTSPSGGKWWYGKTLDGIGVISGGSTVAAPTGRVRVGPDLNQTAAGKYVYFIKHLY